MATTQVTVSTLASSLAVLKEAQTEITNAQTVLASETADDNAKTTALATANASLTNVNAEISQFIAAINSLNVSLASPVQGP
jgi:trans-aconitate methyltransferase